MAFGVWTRLQGLVFGGAIGAAFSKAIEPILEPVRQKAWQSNQVRILDPRTLADLSAKGFTRLADMVEEAGRNGIDENRLLALYALAQTYPGLADTDKLSNRGLISPAQVEEILTRHGFGASWHDPIKALFSDLLSADQVANAVQQGHMPNDDILPSIDTTQLYPEGYVAPTAPDGHPPSEVPLTQIDLDPIKEAAGDGITLDRLKVLANLSGLPPPQGELIQMLNRGLISDETFDAGVREGHTKTKWIGAVKRLRWAVLSAPEYAEARLRSWIDDAQMYAGGALTGHTQEQMDFLYRNRGRPATPRQLWLGWARKFPAPDYPDKPANGRLTDFEDHELAIARSNIRPEYAPLLWDIRFNYPSLFQLNNLVKAGAITPETAGEWAGYNLYGPDVVSSMVAYWQTVTPGQAGAATGPSPIVKSQRSSAVTVLRKVYLTGARSRELATEDLQSLGYGPQDIAAVLSIWDTILTAETAPAPGTAGPT
jgi:hypothetical protein